MTLHLDPKENTKDKIEKHDKERCKTILDSLHEIEVDIRTHIDMLTNNDLDDIFDTYFSMHGIEDQFRFNIEIHIPMIKYDYVYKSGKLFEKCYINDDPIATITFDDTTIEHQALIYRKLLYESTRDWLEIPSNHQDIDALIEFLKTFYTYICGSDDEDNSSDMHFQIGYSDSKDFKVLDSITSCIFDRLHAYGASHHLNVKHVDYNDITENNFSENGTIIDYVCIIDKE